jgi:hypothetical protein
MLRAAFKSVVGDMRSVAAVCMVLFFVSAVAGIWFGKPAAPVVLPVMLVSIIGWVAFGWKR